MTVMLVYSTMGLIHQKRTRADGGVTGRLELWFQTENSSAVMSETHLDYFYVMTEEKRHFQFGTG